MNKLFLSSFIFIILVCSLVSAVEISEDNIISGVTINKIEPPAFDNFTGNVNSSDRWSTGDRGLLRNVADILHSWLDANSLLWSNAGHTIDTTFDFNSQSATNLADLSLTNDITLNPFNWLVPEPTLGNHTANKKYVDDAVSATAFDFFFTNHTSDLTGHFNMTETSEGHAENTLTSASFNAVITVSVFNWTTIIGQPEFTELRQGIFDVHLHLNKNVGGRTVTITPKLYNISSDGSERTLLITFETSDELTTSVMEYDLHGTLSSPIMISSGNRLNLELVATITTGGGGTTVTATQEGTADSHLTVETSSAAFSNIFLRRDGENTPTNNIDWNNKNLTNVDIGFFDEVLIGTPFSTRLSPLHVVAKSPQDYAITLEEKSGGDTWGIGVNGDGDLVFIDSTTPVRFIIQDGTGFVGIGGVALISPSHELNVDGDGNITKMLYVGNVTSNFFFGNGSQLTGLTESQITDLNHNVNDTNINVLDINATNISGNTIIVKSGQAANMDDGLIMRAGGAGAPDGKFPSYIQWESDNTPTIEGYMWVKPDETLNFDDTKPTSGASTGKIQLAMSTGGITGTSALLSTGDLTLSAGNALIHGDLTVGESSGGAHIHQLVLKGSTVGGPPVNAAGGQIEWYSDVSAGVAGYMYVGSASPEDTRINFDDVSGNTAGADTPHASIDLTDGGMILNDQSTSTGDFRWESNAVTNGVLMDASAEWVSIGNGNIILDMNGTILAKEYGDSTPADNKTDDEALQSIISYSSYIDLSTGKLNINDSDLSDFVKIQIPISEEVIIEYSEEWFNNETKKNEIYYWNETKLETVGYEDGRSLSNAVTEIWGGIKSLFNWNTEQDERIATMEATLCNLGELEYC